MNPTNAQLNQFIMQAFEDHDLESFCFDHFPEVRLNFTEGMTKQRKVLMLIDYCDTRRRRNDLCRMLEEAQPSLWYEDFGSHHEVSSRQTSQLITPSSTPDIDGSAIQAKTGIEFVRIPAGRFESGEAGKTTEIELPEYWISRGPVTNEQYKRFIDSDIRHEIPYSIKRSEQPYVWNAKTRTFPEGKADHPVVIVNWHKANAFCDWAGLRIPTEQEWEKAARGSSDARVWPWGNEWIDNICNTMEAQVNGTSEVGGYSPTGDSPFGCVDMAGNVWEWTDTAFKTNENLRVIRGGSWRGTKVGARVWYRTSRSPEHSSSTLGFRVAVSNMPHPLE